LTTLKIAVFAPMPTASEPMAMAANAGLRRSERTPYRMSLPRSWNQRPRTSRYDSSVCSTLPKSMRAARRASAGDRP
jgi:hypothetical protein